MAEPLPQQNPEIPTPQSVVVGETPIYLKNPVTAGDTTIDSIVIQPSDKRGVAGIESSVLVVKEPSRKKGEEGTIIDKPVLHVDPMDQMDWDKIEGIQWTDEGGVTHIIPKEKLSLTPPEPVSEIPSDLGNLSDLSTLSDLENKPKAREILAGLTEDPNTITIVGLRTYETRALDLADRAMQKLGSPKMQERAEANKNVFDKTKDTIKNIDHFVTDIMWKQSIGGIYFHEKARQYYMDMITAAETPFAEQSIRLAEARATEAYNKKLSDSNFIVRAGTKIVDALRSNFGMRTTIQNIALVEIGVMKERGELAGAEIFEREAKAVRTRFGQDMDKADQFVRTQLGEKLEILDPAKTEHQPLVEGIQGLLKQYASGEITDKADFDKRTKEFFAATLKNVRPDIFAEAELYSSSLFESAEMLRNKMSHEGGLANIDEALAGMQIRLGMGAMGEVTSLEPTAVERGIGRVREVFEWLNKKNVIVPMVFNEGAIGTGVAIALSATNLVRSMSARAVLGITGGAMVGGAFAGWKEYGQLQKEYLTHLRERETGTQFTETQKRRAWFEKFSVKQRNANEMMSTLQTAMDSNDYKTAMATIADLQARKAVSETGPKRIGLVQYSNREAIESERSALDIVANKALGDLSNLSDLSDLLGGNTFPEFMEKLTVMQTQVLKQGVGIMNQADDPIRETLGLVSHYAPEATMMQRRFPFIGKEMPAEMKTLGMDQILSEFNKEARVSAIKYGVKAGIIGAAVGTVIHEVSTLFAHGPDIVQQAKEAIQDKTAPAVFTVNGAHTTENIPLSQPDHIVRIGTMEYKVPNEISIVSHTSRMVDGHAVGPDDGVTTYDAVIHTNVGGLHDITLGSNMSDAKLTETLNHAGLSIHEGQVAGAVSLHDGPTITLPGGDTLPTKLPEGMELKFDAGNNDWALLDHDTVIASHITFDAAGNASDNLESQLATQFPDHTIIPPTVIHHAAIPSSPDIQPATTEMMPIKGSEFQKDGMLGYFLNKSHGENMVSAANGEKNLFRLYTLEQHNSNVEFPNHTSISEHLRPSAIGDELNPGSIPPDATIRLPKELFGDDALKIFGDINDAAIKDFQTILTKNGDPIKALAELQKTNPVEATVLKLGYFGDDRMLPSQNELIPLYEKLGVAVKTTTEKIIESGGAPIPQHDTFTPFILSVNQEAIPGEITATTGTTINLPFSLPSEIAHEAAKWSGPASLDESYRAALHETITAKPLAELPWFPVFIPLRAGLEMAPTFVPQGGTTAGKQETLLSPFGMEEAFLTKDAIEGRKSPRLTENPAAKLSQSEEIAWYLDQLSEQDKNVMTELTSQIETPLSPDVRAIITLLTSGSLSPMYDRLATYLGQTNNNVEFIVYDPILKDQAGGTAKADVDRFLSEHPETNIRYITHEYTEPQNVGQLKRDLTNAVLSRIGTLPADHPDVVIISDNGGNTINPTYLDNAIGSFDTDLSLDMLAGENKLNPEAYQQFPMLFAQHRAFELFDALVRHGESGHVPGVISGNTVVRASTLAGVGGYNNASPVAEDRELAWLIAKARGNSDTIATKSELTATIDPTETAYRMLQHVGVADKTVGRSENETYKTLGWQEMAQKANESYTKEQLESDLTNLYTSVYPSLKDANPARHDEYFKRTMDALGIQYELKDNAVVITDMTNLPTNMAADMNIEEFAKQAATEITPQTPRESLETMAGSPEPQPETAPTETLSSSVSSPDLGHLGDLGNLENQTQKPESLPEGVEDRVNYVINKSKESSAAVDITTGELMDYMKTRLELAGNTRITEGNIQIDGSNVQLNDMVAKSLVGETTFNTKMITDPQKGLMVDMQSTAYHLPLLMRLFEGRIKNQLNHFDDTLLLHMSQRIPANWKAERLDIVGEKLQIKFAKKT